MTEVIIMAAAQSRREWLQRALRASPRIQLMGVAPALPYLRSLMDEKSADVVVIDVDSRLNSEILRTWLPDLLDIEPIVLLAPGPDSVIFNSLVRAERGAMLRTDASADQIVHAVEAVSAGLLIFDSSLIPQPETGDELYEELTPREIDVLRLLAEGLANREIANRLNISEHTIKFHIGSILGKLGASSRTEAVTRGLRAGLIEL